MSSILAAGTWGWYQTWTSFGWIGGAFREKHRSCFRCSMFFSGAWQIWMPGKGSKAAQGDQWKVLTQSRWLRHSCSYQFCHVNLRPTICHKGVTWCLESPFVGPSRRFILDTRRLFLKVSSSSRIKETEKSKESSTRQDIGHGFRFWISVETCKVQSFISTSCSISLATRQETIGTVKGVTETARPQVIGWRKKYFYLTMIMYASLEINCQVRLPSPTSVSCESTLSWNVSSMRRVSREWRTCCNFFVRMYSNMHWAESTSFTALKEVLL